MNRLNNYEDQRFENLFRIGAAKWAILKWTQAMRVIGLRSNEAPHQHAWAGLQTQAQYPCHGQAQGTHLFTTYPLPSFNTLATSPWRQRPTPPRRNNCQRTIADARRLLGTSTYSCTPSIPAVRSVETVVFRRFRPTTRPELPSFLSYMATALRRMSRSQPTSRAYSTVDQLLTTLTMRWAMPQWRPTEEQNMLPTAKKRQTVEMAVMELVNPTAKRAAPTGSASDPKKQQIGLKQSGGRGGCSRENVEGRKRLRMVAMHGVI